MDIKEIFEGVFRINGKLATRNLVRGVRVYDEELVEHGGTEYRMWNPYRSKLAASIINGLKTMSIKTGKDVLYLGAATGTTTSHVSDIIGDKGTLYCIEISERNMRELVKVCDSRPNMLPMLRDARDVDAYAKDIGECDVLYQDISARDQSDILNRNARLLKKGGIAYVAIKSQSIDVTEDPEVVYKVFLQEVSGNFEVLEKIDIAPYSKLHMFAVLKKR
ncbi:Fibrillarin-like rRNA/tRNA 2'-O-methyltransferase [uncultured archaeon]|nr:Fibrillarin-like rRNA/tRNA 2'-O-methyltransferase [uncultured archaeon]